MLRRWLWPHRVQADLLSPHELATLRRAVLESPFLAATDLNEGFEGTSGFTLLFHLEERTRAEQLMPELAPFLARVVKKSANVFFLNPLVIHAGGTGVAPHADKTLVSYVEEGEPPFPFCVSVLYLSLPVEKRGGSLVFHRRFGRLERRPAENLLVEFPGWMLHEVTPLQSQAGSPPRVSLVLEQYALSAVMKAQVPSWSLETTRPFSEFLELAEHDQQAEHDEDLPEGEAEDETSAAV